MLLIHSREELEHHIITLHAEGWSIRSLTRRFCMGRNTVRRILRKNRSRRESGHSVLQHKKRRLRKSKLDEYRPLIKQLLEKYPDITGVRMYEELKRNGYRGGKTIVTDYLRKIRPKPKKKPVIRFETAPGVQGQMDWSTYTLNFSQTGTQKVLCFSYILGFSRRQYIDFTVNRKFFTLIRRHQDAFNHFRGVPATCLYDGEKTVILRWEAGQPIFNPAFVAFITHYLCHPIACPPATPEYKGKVESPFQYIEKNLLNARTFYNLEDLRSVSKWWLLNRSDTHKHDTTGRPPIELFLEQEQAALKPLPIHAYDTAEVALRVCRIDGFLEFETNMYSVPYEYVADILTMKATENEVFIYSPSLKLIACHERKPIGSCLQIDNPAHRTSKKVRYGLEPVRESFLSIGDATEEFLNGLKLRHPHHCGFQARYILRLKEHYHTDDIHEALKHALKYHAFEGKTIERILKARFTPRPLEAMQRGLSSKLFSELPEIKQRDLEDYCDLFKEVSYAE